VPYEPFRPDRIKPQELLKNLKREFVDSSLWVPIEEGPQGIVILATDPEQVKNARVINNIFPKAKLNYRVTTNAEFRQTVDQFFGGELDAGSVNELLSGLDEGEEDGGDVTEADLSAAAENELVKLVNKIIIDAYKQGVSDIHIEPLPQGRIAGTLHRGSGKLPQCAGRAHQDHVRPRYL
jgi:type II secretory ATPase GspE/PulE/Tfp pilus assembly ATPase PilB-like protein